MRTLAAVECDLEFDVGDGAFDLGGGIFLTKLPELMKGKDVLDAYGRQTRNHVLEKSAYAVFLDAELDSFDDEENDWKGPQPRKRIDELSSRLSFVLVAFWIQKPAAILARAVIQVPDDPGKQARFVTWREFGFLPGEENERFTREDLDQTREWNSAIQILDRPHTPWLAVRMLQGALIEENWELRYLTMWIVLETLFGPREAAETTHRLAERIAVFVKNDVGEREVVYRQVKKAYGYRCRIAHGDSWKVGHEESLDWLAVTEGIVRAALRKILGSNSLVEQFSTNRERYLLLRCLGLDEAGELPPKN